MAEIAKRLSLPSIIGLSLILIFIVLTGQYTHAQTPPAAKVKEDPSLAMFIPNEGPFWRTNARFAHAAASSLGVNLQTINFKENTAQLLRKVEDVCKAGIDGIIFPDFGIASETILKLAEKYNVGAFLINDDIKNIDYLPRTKYRNWLGKIIPNDAMAGGTLIQQLLQIAGKAGVSRFQILAIEGLPSHSNSSERLRGMKNFLKYNKQVDYLEVIPGNWDPATAAKRFKDKYKENPAINLVWCANDDMALAVAEAARELKIVTPLFIGGIDWSPRAIEAIEQGIIQVSVGGQFIEGVWAVILLHDYLQGRDFAGDGTSFSVSMSAITKDNLQTFSTLFKAKLEGVDFQRYSKVHNPERVQRTFDLIEFARNYETEKKSAAFLNSLSAEERDFLKHNNKIKIGSMEAWPPMNFLDSAGAPSGYGADLLNAINWRLGGRLEIVPGPFAENYRLVKDKKLDGLMDITPKPEREQFFNFTRPYMNIPHVIVARSGGPFHAGENNLRGKTLALEKGFGNVKYFTQNYPDVKIKEYPDTSQALNAVSIGQADAYAGNRAVAAWIMETELISNLQVQGRLNKSGSILAIGVRKDWPILAGILDKAVKDIPQHEIRSMKRRWAGFTDPVEDTGQLSWQEKTFLKAHLSMRLGVAPDWAPFDFMDSQGKHAGICSDYLRIIGHKLGTELTPVKDLTWTQMLAEARAGRIDIISAIVSTEERRQFLRFSRPYLKVPLVIITREDAPYIGSLADIKEGAVAVVRDYVTQTILQEKHPGLELIPEDTVEQALRAVAEGKAAAAVDAVASLEYANRSLGLTNLKVAAPTPYSLEIAIGVRKDLPLMVPILNKVLASFTEDDKSLIQDKWLKVRIEKHIDWGFIIKAVVLTCLVGFVILAVILIWNRRLAGEIAQRKAAEERFQTMAAHVPGALVQLKVQPGGEWEYLFLSQNCIDFFGFPAEEVIKNRLRTPWHPDDKPRIDKDLFTALKNQEEFNLVGRTTTKSGEVRWTRINASPSKGDNGETIYNGFILDITDRKLAELEYLASERKVKAMSQAASDALVMIDAGGKVMFWNSAAERLFGYSAEEAMGMDFHSMAAPEKYHKDIKAGLAHFAKTGQGKVLGAVTEATGRNRAGEEFPVEITLSSFQIDEEWYAVGVVRDITKRKRAEQEIRRSHENFRIIADYTYDWEGWHGKDGALLWVNPAVERITGYSVDECMAMPDYPFSLLLPDDKEIWESSLARALAGEAGNDVPFRVRHKDGNIYWITLSWNPIFDQEKKFSGFRTSARDFTERKESEDQLRFTQFTVDKAVQSIFWLSPRTGKFIYANDAACQSLGYSPSELLNMTAPQIDLDLTEEKQAEMLKALHDRQVVETHSRHQTKSGEILDVELTISLVSHDEEDVIIAFAKDITKQKQAEKDLLESQQRLDLALEGGNLGTWDRSFIQDETVVDDRWAKLMGLKPGQIDNPFDSWVKAIHPDDIERVREQGRKYVEGLSDHYEVSYRIVLNDGEERWQITRGKAVSRDENGRVTRMVGTVMDVTAQMRAERALQESEERSRLLLASAGEGIFGVDTDDRLTFINPTALEMLGFSEPEILGQKVHELIHHSHADGSTYPLHECPMYGSVTQGQCNRVNDEVLWRKNGSHFPVSYSSTPVSKNGQLMGAVITFRDITEQLNAEKTLRSYSDRLTLATAAGGFGVWEWDLATDEISWDQRCLDIYRAEPGEFNSMEGWRNKVHPQDLSLVENALDQAVNDQGEYNVEYRIVWPDNSIRHIKVAALTVKDEGGKLVSMIGVTWDITDRKEAELELQQNFEDLERFSRLVVGREEKMIQLKEEINHLMGDLGRESKYKIVH